MGFHKLLARQLRKIPNLNWENSPELQQLLRAVDEAYHQADADRMMLTRSIDLSSRELNVANRELMIKGDRLKRSCEVTVDLYHASSDEEGFERVLSELRKEKQIELAQILDIRKSPGQREVVEISQRLFLYENSADVAREVLIPVTGSENSTYAVLHLVAAQDRVIDKDLQLWVENLANGLGIWVEIQLQKRELEEHRAQAVNGSKMASLGLMAGGVAHEINNPLAVISLLAEEMVDLLGDESLSPTELKAELSQSLQKVSRTTERIAKIVKGLRSFSRDSTHDPVARVTFANLLDQTTSFCMERFRLRSVNLIVDPIEPELWMECREAQISQVLLNLLNNAFDAVQGSENAWVRISHSTTESEIVIQIRDSGKGISPEVSEKLFQPFFTTKSVGKGTGLGLNISHAIARAHDGELFVDRTDPNTCFVLRLPREQKIQREAS